MIKRMTVAAYSFFHVRGTDLRRLQVLRGSDFELAVASLDESLSRCPTM